jgi:hypothetical protein
MSGSNAKNRELDGYIVVLVWNIMLTYIQTRPVALTGPAAPSLGTTVSFRVLSGSTATNAGLTTINSVRLLVVMTETYSVQQANDPAVLAQIYGIGPVSGPGPQAASDGRSHLTLINCGGEWVYGPYSSRLVVYPERLQTTLKAKPVGAGSPCFTGSSMA